MSTFTRDLGTLVDRGAGGQGSDQLPDQDQVRSDDGVEYGCRTHGGERLGTTHAIIGFRLLARESLGGKESVGRAVGMV